MAELEEDLSQSLDNQSPGNGDGIYTYPGKKNTYYQKKDGNWYKKVGNSDYQKIQSGDVESRVELLEKNAVPFEIKSNIIPKLPKNIAGADLSVNEIVEKAKDVKLPPKIKIEKENDVFVWKEYDPESPEADDSMYKVITNPKRVNELNKKYKNKASTSPLEMIYTGFPNREDTEYKVSSDNLWQKKEPGSEYFYTVSNPESIKYLNNHFKQNADILDEKKSKEIVGQNNYIRDFNARLTNINSDLIGKDTDDVLSNLQFSFPEFKFERNGSSGLRVYNPKDKNDTNISLDNWFSSDDKLNAEKLRAFLKENVLSNTSSSYNNWIQSQAVLEGKISKAVLKEDNGVVTKDIADATNVDRTVLNEQVRRDLGAMSNVLFPKEAEKIKTAEKQFINSYSDAIKNTYSRVKDKSEDEKNAAFAAIKTEDVNDRIVFAVNKFGDEVKDKTNDFVKEQKAFNAYIQDINEKVKSGEISKEDYDANYKKYINGKVEELNLKSSDLQTDLKTLNSSQFGVNKSIAGNYLLNEKQGTFVGGLTRSVVQGVLDLPFYVAGATKKEKKEFVDGIINSGTTEEYMNSDERWDITKAAFQMTRSLSAMAAGAAFGGPAGTIGRYATLYAMSYNEMKDDLDAVDISNEDKVLMSSAYGLVGSVLENFGIGYLLGKSALKVGATNWILKTAFSGIPKGASKEFIEAQIMNSTKMYISKMAVTGAGSSLVEGATEASQAAVQVGIKEVYDEMKKTDYFNNKSSWQILGDIGYNGYMGSLGAGIVETVQQSGEVLNRGKNAFVNKDQMKLLIKSAKLNGIDQALLSNLKASILNGKISTVEAKEIVRSFQDIKGKINSMPDEMSVDKKSVALDLMVERDNLNKKIEGKEPTLVVKEKARIDEINNQLKNVDNAVQEPSTEEILQRQPETTGEAGGERGGVEQVVQGEEVAQEGGEQATAQKEITPGSTAKIAGVDIVYPTESQAEERKAFRSTTEYVENASKDLPLEDVESLSKELEGDFGLLTADNPMAQPLTEEENKQLSQKAEEWLISRGYKPRRVTGKYEQAENSFFVPNLTRQDAIEFAKEFNQDSVAHSDGMVYQNGSINPRVKQNDDLSFTEGYSPDSNLVSVVNTKDGLKTFSIGYNFEEKVNPEPQPTVVKETATPTFVPETSQTVTERINKETDTKRKKVFTAVQKVLSAIPNSRIILHDNTDAFVAGVAKSANITNDQAISQGVQDNRGSYVNGDIHINLEKAGVSTVFHEAFHDLLSKKGFESGALLEMAKGLKSVISDKGLKARLDKFVSNYEQGERAEEYTTELGAIMSEAQKELTTTKWQQFKTLINNIGKKLGIPVVFAGAATAQDAVDFMNSMAGKIGRGEQIEVGDLSKVVPSKTDKYGNLIKPSESSIKNIKSQKEKIVDNAKSNVIEGKTVSTRLPKKDDIHSTRDYIVSMKSLEAEASKDKKIQDQYIKIAKEISSYGISKIKNVETFDDAKKVVNDFKNSVKSNLKWLYNSFGNDVRDISKLWYDGANIICNNIATKYNYSLEQVSGVMAVLSPQMDWFRNLSLGERVIDIYTNQQNSIFDSKMIDYVSNATSGTGKNKVPLFKDSKEIISRVKNKKLSELNNKDKAYFIRVFDEVYNSREYNNISPNGEINGLVRKSDGSPGACGWGAFPTIEKSISILQNGSIENISSNLGNMHKVRNFFNNISNPNDPDAVTIDTHAVAAGLLLPLSGSSKQVLYNFGGAGNVNTGMTGTYPVYADAYRELAKELGLLPREVQSITWEAVRGLFKATFKSNKNNELNINKVWDDYSSGSISLDEVHTKIEDIAGGISKPVWFEYMADGDKISMDENSAALDQSNLDNESEQPSNAKKIKAQKTEPVAGNKLFNEPLKDAETIAKSYMKSIGMEYVPVEKINKLDENLSKRIADAYDKMKNDPNDPDVKKAYEAMAKETLDQYDAIVSKGYKVEINNDEPYSSSEDMISDLKDNKRMKIFSTESGFGDEPITEQQRKENVLLTDSGRKDANGETLLVNDVFRFVHDFFGHAKLGNSFGPIGEENAWRVHAVMYSPEARKAMTSETRGQNSWVNFSGVNDAVFKKRDKARELRKQGKIAEADQMVGEVYEDMKFADQKVGLLPEFAVEEGSPSKIKAQKQSKEDAIQSAKDIHEKSFKRFKDEKRAIANAINNLEKSDWYKNADDTQREQAVVEVKQSLGVKIKRAPSVAKVMGKTKQTAVVSDIAAAIRDQVKLQARSSRETAKTINEKRKELGEAIKQVVNSYKGKITDKQLNAINKRIANVNLFNQEMVDRVVDYVEKVMNNADYARKLSDAFAERKAIKRMMKSGNQAETVAIAREFTIIDPSMVEDIDAYLDVASKIRASVKTSRKLKGTVSLKEMANFQDVYGYIKPEIDRQEQMMKNMLLAEYKDLTDNGTISNKMSLDDINKIIKLVVDNQDENKVIENEEKARDFLNQKLESIKSTIFHILKYGTQPFTGESVVMSDRIRSIVNNILKSDLNEMSTKQMIQMADSLNNFIENGAIGGLEDAFKIIEGQRNIKTLVEKGVKARPLKLYFSKKLGDIASYEVASLTELFNRMFVGVTKGLDVLEKSGFADVILGANKARRAVKDIQERYVQQFKNIKNFFDVEQAYERGILSFLYRNVIGSELEMSQEFNRRVDMLLESLETLKNGDSKERKMAKVYESLFEKLDIKSRDLEKITSNATPHNMEAVNWWINEWSSHYDNLSEVSKSVYNMILGKDFNYTPDRYKMTAEGSATKTISSDLVERNSSFLINTDSYTDKKESGVMIASVHPDVLPKGRYVSLDFDVNNIESLTGALVDIETAGAIRQVDAFFNSNEIKKLIPTVEDRNILIPRINRYIRRSKNKLVVPSDVFRKIDDAANTVAAVGSTLAMGGIFQSIKQSIPVVVSTAINTGSNFKLYAGKSFNDWLNTTGATVSNRGQESVTAVESANKKIQSFNGNFDKAVQTVKGLTQWQLKTFLSRPDVLVARSAFKSYYTQYMKQNTSLFKNESIDWSTLNEKIKSLGLEEVNKKAIIYADVMVSRQQNISDERLAGELLTSEDSLRKLLRKVVFPFASFSINQRARLVADINTLYVNYKNVSSEDRAIAIKSIAGTLAEQGVFQMINFALGMLLYEAAAALSDNDEDDEEWKKRMQNATKYPLKSFVADLASPNPVADDAVIWTADKLLDMFGKPKKSEIDQAVADENEMLLLMDKDPMTEKQERNFREEFVKENTYQLSYNFTNGEEGKYGMISIAPDQYAKIMKNYEMAENGTFTNEYMGKETTKYLTDKDKAIAKSVFYALEMPFTTGVGLKEMGQVANKTYSIIKKRGLTEDQYEIYKSFKKEYKKEPNTYELKMIKSGKSYENISDEINFIDQQGGLNTKQGIEYSKLFDKTGFVTKDQFEKISKGMKYEDVIKTSKKTGITEPPLFQD
jgi:hypothetical protein